MAQYAVPEGVLIYLIQQSVDGSAERRLAAKFLLDCLRAQQTTKGIAERIDALEGQSILNITEVTRRLAGELRLIP
jgi:hypothetical protein